MVQYKTLVLGIMSRLNKTKPRLCSKRAVVRGTKRETRRNNVSPSGRQDDGTDLVTLEVGLSAEDHLYHGHHEGQRLPRSRHGLDAHVFVGKEQRDRRRLLEGIEASGRSTQPRETTVASSTLASSQRRSNLCQERLYLDVDVRVPRRIYPCYSC